jgi:dimethylhistidine N-methyltransferase
MSGEQGRVNVLDLEPALSDFLGDVVAGLSGTPRTLPCKYFYDARGAELFGDICETPEYYITRTELRILKDNAAAMSRRLGSRIELIGFGTGAGTKTRLLLEQLSDPVAYVPVDISREQLLESSLAFSELFPSIEILPVCADYLQPIELPTPLRKPDRIVVYFPGSTIGNFEPRDAQNFLRRIARACSPGGGLLIGVDLQKPKPIIERAYNDAAGVTAAFNLNLLVRANRELGANFNLAQWRHDAVYNESQGRIEMYLISKAEQTVRVADRQFRFAPDEKIITEFSYKHSREGFSALAADVGFRFEQMWTDAEQLFGVFYFTVAE